jgi:V/A-type H+-transporting ATPase subunit C
MPDLDYGNARLRAMKSRLLSRRTLQELAEAGSVQGLITGLTNTAYREAVEAALVRLSSLECLAEALRNDLIATVGKARAFYSGPAGELAALVFRRYDLHNVKTVLRGLTGHVPASEILANTLPIGELRPADLAELTRMENWHAAIDLLATWRLALARPLLELRAARRGRNGGADLFEMEVALDRWHTRTAMQAVAEI